MVKLSRKTLVVAIGSLACAVAIGVIIAPYMSSSPEQSASAVPPPSALKTVDSAVPSPSESVAAAAPDPIVNTTCSYEQFVAALNAQSPDTAKAFNANPEAQAVLHKFLDSPVDQRQQVVAQAANTPQGKQLAAGILQLANTCHNY